MKTRRGIHRFFYYLLYIFHAFRKMEKCMAFLTRESNFQAFWHFSFCCREDEKSLPIKIQYQVKFNLNCRLQELSGLQRAEQRARQRAVRNCNDKFFEQAPGQSVHSLTLPSLIFNIVISKKMHSQHTPRSTGVFDDNS